MASKMKNLPIPRNHIEGGNLSNFNNPFVWWINRLFTNSEMIQHFKAKEKVIHHYDGSMSTRHREASFKGFQKIARKKHPGKGTRMRNGISPVAH